MWIPPKSLWTPIQRIREQYDRKIYRWMPHVTLLYPFWEKHWFDLAKSRLTAALAHIRPFPVFFRTFSYFRHTSTTFTIWLVPEPSDCWMRLEETLIENFPDCTDQVDYPTGFIPHLSVGQFSGTEQDVRHRVADLQSRWKALSATVRSVYLIWRDDPPNDQFRIWSAVKFGGTPKLHDSDHSP